MKDHEQTDGELDDGRSGCHKKMMNTLSLCSTQGRDDWTKSKVILIIDRERKQKFTRTFFSFIFFVQVKAMHLRSTNF